MGTCAVCGKSGADPTSFLSYLHGQDAKLEQCRYCETGFGGGTAVCYECLEREKVPMKQGTTFSHRQGKRGVTEWQCPDCGNWNSANRRTFVEDLDGESETARSRSSGASSTSSTDSSPSSRPPSQMPEDMVETGARVNQDMYDVEVRIADTRLEEAKDAIERGDYRSAETDCRKAITKYEKAKDLTEGESAMPDAQDTQDVDDSLDEAESLLETIRRRR